MIHTFSVRTAVVSTFFVAATIASTGGSEVSAGPVESSAPAMNQVSVPSSNAFELAQVGKVTSTQNPVDDAREVVMSKLATIRNLRDGWDGPGSVAVGALAFREYQSFIDHFQQVPDDLEPMPTPSGGLRMEWERGDSSYVVELERSGGMFLCALGDKPDDIFEIELDSVDADLLVGFYEGGHVG